MTAGRGGIAWRLGWAAAFLALTAGAGIGFLKAFAPDYRPMPLRPAEGYDSRPMDQAVSPHSVSAGLDEIAAFGGRFLGDEGLAATERHIRRAFASAGLETYAYPVRSAAPRTIERRIVDANGRPLEGVEIYPFMPNHFQPMVTPAEGLSGRLVLVSEELLKTRPAFDDAIALIDAADPPTTTGLSWTRYAEVGFRAVVVAHRGGLEAIDWNQLAGWNKMVSSTPVNHVRLAANGAIFAHVGHPVRLHVRQEYRNVPNTVLVGILRGGGQAREALAVCTGYDAASMLPDHAPGLAQAVDLAAELALLKGLAHYRSSIRRDVIFVAHGSRMMAHDGLTSLLAALGPNRVKGSVLAELRRRLDADRSVAEAVRAVLACFDRPGFFAEPDSSTAAVAALSRPAGRLFAEQLTRVLGTLVFELSERQLQAKLVFLHDPTEDLEGEPFRRYIAAKDRYNEAMTVAGYPLGKLLRAKAEFVSRTRLAERFRARLDELLHYHTEQIAAGEAAVAIHQAFARYRNVVPLTPMILPAPQPPADGEAVSFFLGDYIDHNYQGPVLSDVLGSLAQRRDAPAGLKFVPLGPNHLNDTRPKINWIAQDAKFWNRLGYPGLSLVNTDRLAAYQAYGWPVGLPWMRDVRSIRRSLWLLGRAALSLAHGTGTFKPPKTVRYHSFGGQVLASGVGSSTVPNYGLAGALIGGKGKTGSFEKAGFFEHPFIFADPYGRYSRPDCAADVIPWLDGTYSPNAVRFGDDGIIAHIKDEGPLGQAVYKSMRLSTWTREVNRVNIVTFRASPVTILDLINPQTVKPYAAVEFISREGLSELQRANRFTAANDIITTFLEPDRRFFVRLKAGSVDNELVQETRAFILGTGEGDPAPAGRAPRDQGRRVVDGPGYLPGDVPVLLNVPERIARSMIEVNGRRLALQEKYDMADRRTRDFHAKADEFLRHAEAPGLPLRKSVLLARDAVAYATLNHPVLRQSVAEAVVSIVWYLCLLVPFVLFFEKLVFGLTDIRKQLLVQAVTFLVVFSLLWWLHPAFQMIRSSLMILLGFVILLIAGGITVLFAGKFQDNLEKLKTRRGIVTAAEVNKLGVTATAFMLGLNNMHRRRLRTTLTCVTLVLITFAMICFTSIHSDLVDTAVALGKASWQGVLFKKDNFQALGDAELLALQTRYGEEFRVASRGVWVGEQTWERQQFNPELQIVHQPAGEAGRKADFESILQFDADEPLREGLRFLTRTGWFDANSAKAAGADIAVLIPDTMAAALGIAAERVDAGRATVHINGQPFRVRAIFEAASLDDLRDLDGRSLLPFNVEGMTNIRRVDWAVIADEDTDPRVGADRVVLAPNGDLGIQSAHAVRRRVSVAVWMPELPYKAAREQIENVLAKSGRRMYYGLDGTAYVGRRARESTIAGLADLIIPLVIAAMTVLNTMRGSVYERRDEIFVYNAVGIAPRQVFLMFFAEAFVYAVVGAVAGFLLSQSVGRLLTALNWTGGLNMTFTSINTIYISLAIAAAVFASTYFPARSAMQIASPAEEAGWQLPRPDGDEMAFQLPFTFSPRDRIAVLAFFHRFLLDHGEGGAGRFFADHPSLGLAEEGDRLADGACVPRIRGAIWLKPFDLGVSQELDISLPTDAETGEYIARVALRRLSGTHEAWLRLNRGFVRLLRQQFLHWRAVAPPQRAEMFQEGRSLLRQAAADQETTHVPAAG